MNGNLRSVVDGLYDSIHQEAREQRRRKSRAFILLVGSFMIGAVGGALLALRTG